eukprot:2639788-Rhodomonas_salina.1
MSVESPTGSVGSQDPMEPPQNTETATALEPVPGTEPTATGLPSELEPMAEPAQEAEPAHEAEAGHEEKSTEERRRAGARWDARGLKVQGVLGGRISDW